MRKELFSFKAYSVSVWRNVYVLNVVGMGRGKTIGYRFVEASQFKVGSILMEESPSKNGIN